MQRRRARGVFPAAGRSQERIRHFRCRGKEKKKFPFARDEEFMLFSPRALSSQQRHIINCETVARYLFSSAVRRCTSVVVAPTYRATSISKKIAQQK